MMRRIVFLLSALSLAGPAFGGPLHEGIRDDDLTKVRELIRQGNVSDARDENGETPLILAILEGHVEVAELLIEQGADISARNEGGFTPLHAAAYVGDVETAEQLLVSGADVNDQDNKAGVSPLSVAAEEGQVAVARVLVEHGAELEAGDQNGYTALTRALWRGHRDVVAVLQQAGAVCQPVEVLEEPAYSECVAGQR